MQQYPDEKLWTELITSLLVLEHGDGPAGLSLLPRSGIDGGLRLASARYKECRDSKPRYSVQPSHGGSEGFLSL